MGNFQDILGTITTITKTIKTITKNNPNSACAKPIIRLCTIIFSAEYLRKSIQEWTK